MRGAPMPPCCQGLRECASTRLDRPTPRGVPFARFAEGDMGETFTIHAGDVIEVQLTSETVVIETPNGRREADDAGRITNRMRLFVRHPDGKEEKYDFDDTELGVRETQTVAIVRGKRRRAKEPVNLILFNPSSGEHDPFERGLASYLGHKPFFGPLSKALVLALGVAVIF